MICCTANIIAAQSNIFPRENYQIDLVKTIDIDIYETGIFTTNSTSIMTLAKNIYTYDDLAVFCKIEVKIEKSSGFPVKFRLGEVNYVEKMEGKPYSIFY